MIPSKFFFAGVLGGEEGGEELKALGRHILVEYFGCDRKILNDLELVKRFMNGAAVRSGATIVDNVFHLFNPHGVSGVVVIAESHLAIHTWPEYEYAAVDLFTCGETVDPWKAFEFLKEKLESNHSATTEMKRGQIEGVSLLRHKPEIVIDELSELGVPMEV